MQCSDLSTSGHRSNNSSQEKQGKKTEVFFLHPVYSEVGPFGLVWFVYQRSHFLHSDWQGSLCKVWGFFVVVVSVTGAISSVNPKGRI